jgi:hypothetical protein
VYYPNQSIQFKKKKKHNCDKVSKIMASGSEDESIDEGVTYNIYEWEQMRKDARRNFNAQQIRQKALVYLMQTWTCECPINNCNAIFKNPEEAMDHTRDTTQHREMWHKKLIHVGQVEDEEISYEKKHGVGGKTKITIIPTEITANYSGGWICDKTGKTIVPPSGQPLPTMIPDMFRKEWKQYRWDFLRNALRTSITTDIQKQRQSIPEDLTTFKQMSGDIGTGRGCWNNTNVIFYNVMTELATRIIESGYSTGERCCDDHGLQHPFGLYMYSNSGSYQLTLDRVRNSLRHIVYRPNHRYPWTNNIAITAVYVQAQASNLAGLLLLENKIITPNLGHWLRQSRGRGKHSDRITVLDQYDTARGTGSTFQINNYPKTKTHVFHLKHVFHLSTVWSIAERQQGLCANHGGPMKAYAKEDTWSSRADAASYNGTSSDNHGHDPDHSNLVSRVTNSSRTKNLVGTIKNPSELKQKHWMYAMALRGGTIIVGAVYPGEWPLDVLPVAPVRWVRCSNAGCNTERIVEEVSSENLFFCEQFLYFDIPVPTLLDTHVIFIFTGRLPTFVNKK